MAPASSRAVRPRVSVRLATQASTASSATRGTTCKMAVPLMEALDEETGIGFDPSVHPAADQSPLLADIDLGGVPSDPDMLATTLGQHLRPLDRLARLSATELAAILPDCEEDESQDLVVRLLRELPKAARIGMCGCLFSMKHG